MVRVVRVGSLIFAEMLVGGDAIIVLQATFARCAIAPGREICGGPWSREQRTMVGAGEGSLGRVHFRRRDFFGQIVEDDVVEVPQRLKGEVPEVGS